MPITLANSISRNKAIASGVKSADVYVANLPDLAFEPAVHVHYQESVLPIRDGLPKMKDVPAEMGGSGDTLPE